MDLESRVRVFPNEAAEVEEISRIVAESFVAGQRLRILEAGCGRQWAISLPDNPIEITGVDLSREALEYRKSTVGDLSVAILGDIAEVDLSPETFDVAYSAYVLEHVPDAAAVVRRLDRSTRPAGLIVLRLPDRDSVYGFVARHTPFKAHVWFYRYVYGDRRAGTDGRSPFETYYSAGMARRSLVEYLTSRGYQILVVGVVAPFPGKTGLRWRMVRGAMRLFGRASRGRVSGDHTNFFLVARKGTDSGTA